VLASTPDSPIPSSSLGAPGAGARRRQPPAQISSSSHDFGSDIHGPGVFTLGFLDF
jgi:hypothetical protein